MLSNNYVNSIIVHKFDFSDEEIMAYYISFLKTLSLKLNNHTVHFFYNEVSECRFRTAVGGKRADQSSASVWRVTCVCSQSTYAFLFPDVHSSAVFDLGVH